MTHIAGTGRYAPEQALGNEEITRAAGVSDEWILRRTGIRERRVAGEAEGTAAMAVNAAWAALESAAAQPGELGVIVVATTTPDHLTPPTACELQARIGAFGAACFDIEAGFAGWMYALITADALLRAGAAPLALVVGVEKLSTVTDRSDPATGPLFGDAAGAVVLAPGEGPLSLRALSWWADGRLAGALLRPAGGARRPFDERVLAERAHLLKMEGSRLFRPAVRTMCQQADSALERAGLTRGDVGRVIPHQANLRIIQGLAREMELPLERFYVNIQRYGNTGAATVPFALDEALREGHLPHGEPVLLVSFGAGATAGAAVLGGAARA
ncbi:ketoacyl-ACP synthase III [soil metagenome]